MESAFISKKKLEHFEPILQVMKDGENLRKSFTDYILKDWTDRIGPDYMTVNTLDKVFED